MRWPSAGVVVASPRPRVRWVAPSGVGRVRAIFCADRRCERVLDAVETDGRAAQPVRALPAGVVFWRAYEAPGEGALEPSGPVWWFVVPRVAREAPERTSRALAWSPVRDVDGDGRWDPLDLHGVVALREGERRAVRTWLGGQGDGPVTAVGDLDGDGYVDFAGADPLRDNQAGRVLLWRGPLPRGEVAPWRAGTAGGAGGARCGTSPTLSGDFDGDGGRELAVSCPGALDGRGEVRVVALEGAGLGRTVATLHPSVNGYRLNPYATDAGTRALVVADFDDDGYDDLVVGADDARCEWVPVDRRCAASPWVAVYLGGPSGLLGNAPLELAGYGERAGHLGVSAAVFDARDGARGLVVGAAPLLSLRVTATPALTVVARTDPREAAQRADLLVTLPRAEGDDRRLVSNDGAWHEVTGDGREASWRRLQSPGSPWSSVLAEVADVQGDGVPDLVAHAVGGSPRRAVIFVWQADASGQVEAVTQVTE